MSAWLHRCRHSRGGRWALGLWAVHVLVMHVAPVVVLALHLLGVDMSWVLDLIEPLHSMIGHGGH